jgi:hypothetical protein
MEWTNGAASASLIEFPFDETVVKFAVRKVREVEVLDIVRISKYNSGSEELLV